MDFIPLNRRSCLECPCFDSTRNFWFYEVNFIMMGWQDVLELGLRWWIEAWREVRISSKSNSEDRSSWLSHGRRGGLAGSGYEDYALLLEMGSFVLVGGIVQTVLFHYTVPYDQVSFWDFVRLGWRSFANHCFLGVNNFVVQLTMEHDLMEWVLYRQWPVGDDLHSSHGPFNLSVYLNRTSL